MFCERQHTGGCTEWRFFGGRIVVVVYHGKPRMWGIEYHPDHEWTPQLTEDPRLMQQVVDILEKALAK